MDYGWGAMLMYHRECQLMQSKKAVMLHGQHNFPNQHFHLPQKTLVVFQIILHDFSNFFHPSRSFTKEDGCQEIIVKKWYFGQLKTFIIIKIQCKNFMKHFPIGHLSCKRVSMPHLIFSSYLIFVQGYMGQMSSFFGR